MSGKIFELAKPGNVSLWKELSNHFSKPEVKALLAREMRRRDRAGAPHLSDGEPRLRTARVPPFRKIRPANSQRKHHRKHAGLERHRADYRDAFALHLRFSQPGAVTPMAARDFSAISPGDPAELQNRKRAWFTDTLDDVNGVANTIRKMTAEGVGAGEQLIVVTSRRRLDDG